MAMRFGIMSVPRSAAEWLHTARSAEQDGYHTLLTPDTVFTLSPFPALAAAAAVTTTLRLRPNVLADPLRRAAETVRETTALQMLSEGRFELGLGVGRPDTDVQLQKIGRSAGSAAERRKRLIETAATVRAEVDPAPPIVIAAGGPKMLAAAATVADRILLAAGPRAAEADLAELVDLVHNRAADRPAALDPVALSIQIAGIGDRLNAFVAAQGMTAAELRAAGSISVLPDDPAAAADILVSYSEKFGIDEVIVPAEVNDQFTPVLARLR
ncbi:LLM class flavin-dependent oxidoreductase [Nocardia sp. alder85J]|uniref:LLM class flavin-dependent oxidoreductase n=1 Tax=Nocardia sp. alder85J TaxID=2862949 RepID=UPI001CD251EF|nr:LLM class flavin-dependent oxidoreductase [Nocardia sp. alder85J]MCX4093529.1 LLM class flavin-dependent oxidoreductase [Nocardia sp. alder85J]